MTCKMRVLCFIAVLVAYANSAAAQVPALGMGVKSSGAMTVDSSKRRGTRRLFGPEEMFYTAEYTLNLAAGQEAFITAEVAGTGRLVKIDVDDPAGAEIHRKPEFTAKAETIHLPEVGASGKYRVFILSDRIGAFSVRATEKPAEMDEAALREEIERLEKELQEARKRLETVLLNKGS